MNGGESHLRIGESKIFLGEQEVTMTQASEPYYSSGFHRVTMTDTGRYLALRRETMPYKSVVSGKNLKNLTYNEVRIYQIPNIIENGAKIIE